MAKNAKKKPTTRGSQGTTKIGQSAKTGRPAVTRGPTSRSNPTDSIARAPTTRSRTQVDAGQTPLASTRKRKSSESTAQRAGKRQTTRPLTTEDIPTIVRAVRDALPQPNQTPHGSHNLEDTQDTEGTDSTGSDEFGMYLCIYV